jgi:hypothetical protein
MAELLTLSVQIKAADTSAGAAENNYVLALICFAHH